MIDPRLRALALVLPFVFTTAACSRDDASPARAPRPRATAELPPVRRDETARPPRPASNPTPAVDGWLTPRPAWLGKRALPKRPDGFGVVRPTPRILRDRRIATIDLLQPPRSDRFGARITSIPRSVVARSTWRPKCPVSLDQLSYVQMTFWGFDRRPHTGEMIVNASVAEEMVGVFRTLYLARFPIEEMRVVSLKELREGRARPTGDTNVTSSFECRKVTLGESWSQHAYGLAVDVNPFHNPYAREEIVAPELASAYADRKWRRPGMILEGDVVTRAFDAIRWGWGGTWRSLKDWMHFSHNGR